MSALRFRFGRYLGGIAAAQLAMGIHAVIYPWLVIGVLHETPSRLGSALMAAFLPNLLFTLIGGALAESRHGGRWLAKLYLLYVLPLALLLLVLLTGQLSYPLLLGYGLLYGTITAFIQPARESLLGNLSAAAVHRGVARTAAVQSGLQGAGFVLAGYFEVIGLASLLVFQAMLVTAAALLFGLSLAPEKRIEPIKTSLRQSVATACFDIAQGWRVTRDSAVLRDTVAVVLATGVLVFGLYLVGLPLIANHYMPGSAALFGYFQLVFTGGILAANLLLSSYRARAMRSGRMLVGGLYVRGLLLLGLATEPPLWVVFPLIFLWGCSSGLSMTQGRTLVHQEAPAAVRSRVVSIYQLSLFGGAPLGAWLGGVTVEQVGLAASLALFGALSIASALPFVLYSPLWRHRKPLA